MGMSIDTIIKDCEQSIKQSELFIKAHQTNMEISEIKEYQYYIERDKLTISIMRKYQKIEQILNEDFKEYHPLDRNPYRLSLIREVLEDENVN